MATINYTQTDTAPSGSLGSFCSSRSGDDASIRTATNGGTAGTSALNVSSSSSASNTISFTVKVTIDSGTSWASGTWTWRLNVTTANMNITLNEVYICRVDSSDVSQATIGSATALGISCGATGVKSGTISGSAQTPNTGDYVRILFCFSSSAMSVQLTGITPNQNIDSPFTISGRIPRTTSIGHPFII